MCGFQEIFGLPEYNALFIYWFLTDTRAPFTNMD